MLTVSPMFSGNWNRGWRWTKMAKQSFFEYVKAAFNWKVNVPGMGHLPLNKILVGAGIVLGIGNPGFWFLTLALEMGYLWGLSSNKRFQRMVDMGTEVQSSRKWDQRQKRLLESLPPSDRDRYYQLLDRCASIIKLVSADEHNLGDLRVTELNQLAWMFLKLLGSRKKINFIISTTSLSDLEKEIAEVEAKLAEETEGSPLHRSLQGTLDIQKRRLDNLLEAEDSLKFVEAEMDRIEKQVTLLNEEASVSSDPEMLSMRLDSVMTSLSGTSQWMSEQSEYFGMLEDESMPSDLLHKSIEKRKVTE